MKPAFWRGRRVLVTGHTGFKGSWLSIWLQSLGADLVGYALAAPTCPSLFEEAQVASNMRSVIGDIRDLEKLQFVISSHRPEIVIHMAAQPLVRYSYQNPVETYSTNVMGTVNLLESVRRNKGVKVVINITSDKCYENREWLWGYRENEPLGGFDPYSNSKACAELISSTYRSSFFDIGKYDEHGVALATARAGNVIGGGDWAAERLIPDILLAFEQQTVLNIRNPAAIRPWQHVLEPLRAYIVLAERMFDSGPRYSEAWNFGPKEEGAKSVAWVVEQMANLWGNGVDARWKKDCSPHPHEAHFLRLDISKARARLNWHPVLTLQESLKWVVDWAKQRSAGRNVRDLTLDQIQTYQHITNKD